jgi:hypothetical protein
MVFAKTYCKMINQHFGKTYISFNPDEGEHLLHIQYMKNVNLPEKWFRSLIVLFSFIPIIKLTQK